MKYWRVTATRDGAAYPLTVEHVSDQSLRSMRDHFAKYGVELQAEKMYSVPDRAIWRKPTDEERAEGVRDDFVPNDKFE